MDEVSKNSMMYWWPKVAALVDLIPMPKTTLIGPYSMIEWLDEGIPDAVLAEVDTAAEKLGYPCFLRNDLLSGKHSFERTCYVPSADVLASHIYAVVDEGVADFSMASPFVLAVREFIELDWLFKAFDGLPIAPERRVFAQDGKVLCSHFYWPQDAIRWPDREGWEVLLAMLERISDRADTLLKPWAVMLSKALSPDAWSLDFARARDGRWLFIDAALAADSWHSDCDTRRNL